MRPFTVVRAALVIACSSSVAVAQRGGPRGDSTAATNPQANLPYGAPSMEPVSKWTPPASAGRQLTLDDLLTWKSIRGADLSNDGKWFAYVLAPNEGDAEVIVRGTNAGAQEMKFAIGSAPGGGRGGAAGGPTISGNNRDRKSVV